MAQSPNAITLVFAGPDGNVLKKGPYPRFCVQGETLREGEGGPLISSHKGHHWEIEGHKFSRIDCDCGVAITALRVDGTRSKRYGPFESFSFQDGLAYVNHELFAVADRSIGDWYFHPDGQHWPIMLVDAVA